MMHQMASQMLPPHQALQSMPQANGQNEAAGDEPGSFPQLERADASHIQAYEGQ